MTLTPVKNLDVLESNLNWFYNGAFDLVPDGFQLYTVHAMLPESRTVALVFWVTKHKKE